MDRESAEDSGTDKVIVDVVITCEDKTIWERHEHRAIESNQAGIDSDCEGD